MEENVKEDKLNKEVTDIGFAAYLLMKEIKLTSLNEQNEGRYKFIFSIENKLFDKLKFEFPHSESRKFDNSMRMLKMMVKTEVINKRRK